MWDLGWGHKDPYRRDYQGLPRLIPGVLLGGWPTCLANTLLPSYTYPGSKTSRGCCMGHRMGGGLPFFWEVIWGKKATYSHQMTSTKICNKSPAQEAGQKGEGGLWIGMRCPSVLNKKQGWPKTSTQDKRWPVWGQQWPSRWWLTWGGKPSKPDGQLGGQIGPVQWPIFETSANAACANMQCRLIWGSLWRFYIASIIIWSGRTCIRLFLMRYSASISRIYIAD